MKHPTSHQRGASALSMLLLLLAAALVLLIAVKLIPIYVDDYTVQGMLENLQEDENAHSLTVRELKDRIQKRISVNNIDVISTDDIQLVRQGQQMNLTVNYEVRTNLFRNVDAVVHFDHHYEWTMR